MKKKVAWRSQRFSCLPFPAPDVDGARVAHSLSLGGNAYLAQQVHKWIIALSIPQEGRLKPWGRRGFCKTVKVSARQGVFLFFPRCLHALVPHKVWFSLAAFSHTDDLVLLSTAEAWRVCALTGRGWEATEKSWIWNQQLLLWEMRGWSHPPSGRDPGGRWVLQRLPVASCWHRGSR